MPRFRSLCRHFVREVDAAQRVELLLLFGALSLAVMLAGMLIGVDQRRSHELRGVRIIDTAVVEREAARASAATASASAPKKGGTLPWWLLMIAVGSVGVVGSAAFFLRNRWRGRQATNGSPWLPAVRKSHEHGAKRQALRAVLGDAVSSLLKSRLTVRHIMTNGLVTASPDTSTRTLARLFRDGASRHILICDDGQRLLGVVCPRDLRERSGRTARDVMSHAPISVPPGALLRSAVTIALDNDISCLPVVERGRVVGMVTTTDLAFALESILQCIQGLAESQATPIEDTVTIDSADTQRLPVAPLVIDVVAPVFTLNMPAGGLP